MDKNNQVEFQSTAGSASLIGFTAFGGALVGFVLQLLVAFYFGASAETDAYFMALSSSELLSKLLLGGSITAVFIPMFIDRLTKNKKNEAWDLALNIFHISAAIMVTLVILIGVLAEPFVRFIAPGFNTETRLLTVQLLRVVLPSFVLLFLVQLATSMLHALRQFGIPAFLRIIAPGASIIMVVLFIQALGIFSLALGAVLGAVAQLVFLLWGLKQQGFTYRFIIKPFDPAIKRLVYLTYPFIFSVLATQGAGITYRILVSHMTPGSLAALKFSEKITQLLVIIFLNSVTLVIYPLLSEKASRRDFIGMRDTIASSVRLITFMTVPVIIGVALLKNQLIAFIYERGSFTADDTVLTSSALLFLVIGLTTNGISSVFGYATLALQETRASVAISIVMQAVAVSLFVLLTPSMAHNGLALASSLVPLSTTLLYFLYLTRFIPRLSEVFRNTTYSKSAVLAAVLAATITVVLILLQPLQASHTASRLLQLIIPSVLGSIVYFGGAYLWKIPEMQELLKMIHSKLRKWQPA